MLILNESSSDKNLYSNKNEMSFKEIAKILNLPEKQIRNIYYIALKKLQSKMIKNGLVDCF